MIKIIFILIVLAFGLIKEINRKSKKNVADSLLGEFFTDSQYADEQEEIMIRRRETDEFLGMKSQGDKLPPKPVSVQHKKSNVQTRREEELLKDKAKYKKKEEVHQVKVEELEERKLNFDLRKAVVYAEIMNPKFKEY